jgi:competence protein ComEA
VSRLLRAAVATGCLLLALPALAVKKPLAPADRIDLNRASVAELMRLPGVGQKKAQAIVSHRAKAPFQRPDDVVQVKGLGPAWLAKVRPHLTAGAGTAPAATSPPGKK